MKKAPDTDGRRVTLNITGVVQGVGFRMYARDEAARLGLTGWVRNCDDGSVEVLAEGPREALDELIRWCHKGPPWSEVSEVRETWSKARGEYSGFSIGH